MKFYCLINPGAGGYRGSKVISELQKLISENLIEGSVSELSREAMHEQLTEARKYDAIFIGGGDGTISEVLAKLTGSDIPVIIFPLGTGNDLARELGILKYSSATSLQKQLADYTLGKTTELNIWELHYGPAFEFNHTFINYVSLGYDATVIRLFSAMRNSVNYPFRRLGVLGNRMAYTLCGLKGISSTIGIAGMKVIKDNQQIPVPRKTCRNLLFTNIKSIMGLGLSNNLSAIADNKLEFVISNSLINYFGMLSKLKIPFIKPTLLGSAASWEIQEAPLSTEVQIDGEPKPEIKSGQYRVSLAGNVKILLPF